MLHFWQSLKTAAPLLLDGGLATELEIHGHDLNDPLWSAKALMEDPQTIQRVHEAYLINGSQVLTTATYQASEEGFRARGLRESQIQALFNQGIVLPFAAQEATGLSAHVVASAGSYGAYLADGSEYRGHFSISDSELVEFHRRRMKRFASSPRSHQLVGIAFETIPCLREAQAVLEALEDFPQWMAWVSLTLSPSGTHTAQGEDLNLCAQTLKGHPQLGAIGVNCVSPSLVTKALEQLRKGIDLPLVAYPNSGETYDANEKRWHGHATTSAWEVERWVALGARLIGGCCRVRPEQLRSITCKL